MSNTGYKKDLLAFVFEDVEIRNPFLSECGRFDVDPSVYGFFQKNDQPLGIRLEKKLADGETLCILPSLPEHDSTGFPALLNVQYNRLARVAANGEIRAMATIKDIVLAWEEDEQKPESRHPRDQDLSI